MTLAYKDFAPAVLNRGFLSTDYESLSSIVDRANQWISGQNVQVINVETVVLPNLDGQESGNNGIRSSGEMSSYWFQVVRVWYSV